MSKLDEIEERLKASTPGPWFAEVAALQYGGVACVCTLAQSVDSGAEPLAAQIAKGADAVLIAAAPADLAYLLRLVQLVSSVPCEGLDETWECKKSELTPLHWCWPCRMRKELEQS